MTLNSFMTANVHYLCGSGFLYGFTIWPKISHGHET